MFAILVSFAGRMCVKNGSRAFLTLHVSHRDVCLMIIRGFAFVVKNKI